MNKLLSCRYNMDTNRVEARFKDGTTPVSYTHLDVYKRQDFMLWVSADKPQDVAQITFVHANQMIIPCIIQPGHLPGGLAAVSYTHLTYFVDGHFTPEKEYCMNRLPIFFV